MKLIKIIIDMLNKLSLRLLSIALLSLSGALALFHSPESDKNCTGFFYEEIGYVSYMDCYNEDGVLSYRIEKFYAERLVKECSQSTLGEILESVNYTVMVGNMSEDTEC